jgi:AraC-like DNA-binding protein
MTATGEGDRVGLREEFVTADPEEAHEFMRAAYTENIMRITGSREGFRMRHAAGGTGRFSVAEMTHTMAVEHVAEPLGYPLIGRVLRGKIERETRREIVRAGRGDIFLIAQADQPYTVRWDDVVLQMIQVSPAVLAEVAGVDAAPGRLRFTSLVPESPATARNLAATVDFVTSGLLASPEAAASPLLSGGATRLLAAVLLTAFPHEADLPPERVLPGPGGTATLRRAMAFIDEFAGTDISAGDIATGAHVTLRAVQHAFQRHLGTTPMAYLRRVRLDRARQELRAASPAHTTVTEIASRWGFSSPSRFTAHYRAAYGELPRDTLRHS